MSAPPRLAASRPVSDRFNDGRRGFQRPHAPLTDKHTFHNSSIDQLLHSLAYTNYPVLLRYRCHLFEPTVRCIQHRQHTRGLGALPNLRAPSRQHAFPALADGHANEHEVPLEGIHQLASF